jgi:hypothetical protein
VINDHRRGAGKAAITRPRVDSLSSFLLAELAELGVVGKRVAKNLDGVTNAFTSHQFAPYVFTEETPMMAEWSPHQDCTPIWRDLGQECPEVHPNGGR